MSVRDLARFFDQLAEQHGEEAAATRAQWDQLAQPGPWLEPPQGGQLTIEQLDISSAQGSDKFGSPLLVTALLNDDAELLEALLTSVPASDLGGIVNGRWVHFHLAQAAAEHEVAARCALRLQQQASGAVELASTARSLLGSCMAREPRSLLAQALYTEVSELKERLRLARGSTLLHLAVRMALPDAVAALLRHGANPSLWDAVGISPLCSALDPTLPSYSSYTCGIPNAACGAAKLDARRAAVAAAFKACCAAPARSPAAVAQPEQAAAAPVAGQAAPAPRSSSAAAAAAPSKQQEQPAAPALTWEESFPALPAAAKPDPRSGAAPAAPPGFSYAAAAAKECTQLPVPTKQQPAPAPAQEPSAAAPASPAPSDGGSGQGACLPPATPGPAERVGSAVQQTPGSEVPLAPLPVQRPPMQQKGDEPVAAAATADSEASSRLEWRLVRASRRQLQLNEGAPHPPPPPPAAPAAAEPGAGPADRLLPHAVDVPAAAAHAALVQRHRGAAALRAGQGRRGAARAAAALGAPRAPVGGLLRGMGPTQTLLFVATGARSAQRNGAPCRPAAMEGVEEQQPLAPRQAPCAPCTALPPCPPSPSLPLPSPSPGTSGPRSSSSSIAAQQHEPAAALAIPAELRRRVASATDGSVRRGTGRTVARPVGAQDQRSPAAPPLQLTLSTVLALVALAAWLAASVTLPTLISKWLS